MGIDNTYGTLGLRPGVCTSTSRPGSPFDGQVIYETDTNTLAVYDGTSWTSLNPVDRDRNVVINGAMQIAQRNTSVASITAGGYYTADRWAVEATTLGTWTQSVENDAPTGSGFRKSVKMLCTTADSSPAAGDLLIFTQSIEGQNLQKIKKGTSSAERLTISFWVKSNVTGTYVLQLNDGDNNRQVGAQYSVSASGTWEKKTLTFPADTTGAFDNDAENSLRVRFWLAAGSNFTSGTLRTSWTSTTNADIAVGQTNVAAATNNYWQVTGVQLEAGAVATPFEFEDYGTTLAKCQRYYLRSFCNYLLGSVRDANLPYFTKQFPVTMRVSPSFSSNYTTRAATSPAAAGEVGFYGNGWYTGAGATSVLTDGGDADQASFYFTGWTGTAGQDLTIISSPHTWFAWAAEL